jgi:tetratricopeptide (TPR) repeat protein
MWGSLSLPDRETFGLACVLRTPVPRKTLDDTETGVIPADFYGNVRISDLVREKYLSVVDPEKIRTWHSRAADWWMDNGDDEQERLFHLVKSGRVTEACKLVLRSGDRFLENPNDDLLVILKALDPVPKHRESIFSLRARIAIACEDADDARLCAGMLDDYGTPEPDIIRAEAELADGDAEKAFRMASEAFRKHGLSRAAMSAANALFRMGRFDEADVFIGSAYESLSDSVEAARMDEMLFLRAGIAYKREKADDALSYLNKAQRICRKPMMKDRIAATSASIRDGKDPRF